MNSDTQTNQYENDEIDLRELFVAMWRKRYVALLVAIFGLFVGGVVFLLKGPGISSVDSYNVDVRFTFAGSANGEYPNGTPFRLNDLLAPSVVELVYKANPQFADASISVEELTSNLTVTPLTPNRDFIDAKYKTQLANSKLSATEIDELNARFTAELAADTGRYVRISYTASALSGVSPATVTKALVDVPRLWAESAINGKGVLDLQVVVPPRVDNYILDNSEFVVIAEYLRGYAQKLSAAASLVNRDPVAALLADPSSGLDSGDVLNQLSDLSSYHLNVLTRIFAIEPVSRSKNDANLYLQSRIAEVDETLGELDRKARIVSEVYEDYVRSSGQNLSNQLSDNQGGSTYSPQYGDGFLTKLMTIGDELSDAKFKQDLLNRRIEFNLDAQDLKTERNRLADALNALNALDPLGGVGASNESPSSDSAQAIVLKEADYIVTRLNELSDNLLGIVTARESILLGNTGALYELSKSPSKTSTLVPNIISGAKFSLIGLIAGLMFGLMLALFMAALSKKR